MKRGAQPWRKATHGRLEVYYRDADMPWVEVAAAYWEQRLEGLSQVASSRYTLVHRGKIAVGGHCYYFKRFLLRTRRDWLKNVLRGSRAMRTARHEDRLQALGFTVPRTYCVIQERWAGLVGQSALITAACDGATPLRHWLMQPAWQQRTLTYKRAMLKALATEVGHMHRLGVCHGDLHVGNILLQSRNGRLSFIWLDNEHTTQFRVLPLRKRLRNLKRLNAWRYGITHTDRWRFWRAYCATAQIPPQARKALARTIIALTPKKKSATVLPVMTACGVESQREYDP
jgi:tRNA A-37 threonylcarbamoyl transferase component Bud32